MGSKNEDVPRSCPEGHGRHPTELLDEDKGELPVQATRVQVKCRRAKVPEDLRTLRGAVRGQHMRLLIDSISRIGLRELFFPQTCAYAPGTSKERQKKEDTKQRQKQNLS